MIQLKKILVARDFSPCSEQAAAHAFPLARRTKADLFALFVEVPDNDLEPSFLADPEAVHKALWSWPGAAVSHSAEGLNVETVRERGLEAAPVIVRYAKEHAVDLIVVGTHGRGGLRHAWLGSTAEEVLRHAPCPVLVVRERKTLTEAPAITSILVPIDFSEHSRYALRCAKDLAELFDAGLDLIHVVEIPSRPLLFDLGTSFLEEMKEHVEPKLRSSLVDFYRRAVGDKGPAVGFDLVYGDPRQAIAEYAGEIRSGLIVMATHGRTGLQHLWLGSVTERVMRMAPCPVFAFKQGKQRAAPSELEAAMADDEPFSTSGAGANV